MTPVDGIDVNQIHVSRVTLDGRSALLSGAETYALVPLRLKA
jgi:hypothetical protein